MSRKRAYWFFIATVVVVLLSGGYYMTALGLGLFAFVLVDFTEKIGTTIPLLEAMLLMSCLQWIVGPYIDYHSEYTHYKYHMYVTEAAYMDLVVPALFLFSFPLYYFSGRINYLFFIRRIQLLRTSNELAIILVVVGLLAEIAGRFFPASLGFIFFLASGMRFVGLLYLFFSNSRYKWTVFGVLFGFQFLVAVGGGMFHSLLLWSVLMLLFLSIFYRFSFRKKIVYLVIGFSAVFFLQAIKAEYRKAIWERGYQGNRTELFITIFSDKVESFLSGRLNNQTQEEEVGEANNRLNQGWIISLIMKNIPNRTAFLEGETVKEAIYSSFFPRFLDETKKESGGKYAFEKLTGLTLLPGTSMGVSIIGEAYGNFGDAGAYIFMFLWGGFLGFLLQAILRRSNLYYTLPLWLPIIFLQVIKAETDLLTVLNHLVKSTIFVFGVLYIMKRLLNFSV